MVASTSSFTGMPVHLWPTSCRLAATKSTSMLTQWGDLDNVDACSVGRDVPRLMTLGDTPPSPMNKSTPPVARTAARLRRQATEQTR